MEWIIFIKRENVRKAEEKLRTDFDVAAKQSIAIRDAKSLGLKGEGSFFLINGTDDGVKKCQELIKEFVEKIDGNELKIAEKKIKEEEEKAAEGMGGIFNI